MTDLKTKWGNTMPGKGDWIKRVNQYLWVSSYDYLNYDEYEPIPLTPEVLERIEQVQINQSTQKAKIEINEGENEIRFDMWSIPMAVKLGVTSVENITHLHHLQQLYRRPTGEELTINWE